MCERRHSRNPLTQPLFGCVEEAVPPAASDKVAGAAGEAVAPATTAAKEDAAKKDAAPTKGGDAIEEDAAPTKGGDVAIEEDAAEGAAAQAKRPTHNDDPELTPGGTTQVSTYDVLLQAIADSPKSVHMGGDQSKCFIGERFTGKKVTKVTLAYTTHPPHQGYQCYCYFWEPCF